MKRRTGERCRRELFKSGMWEEETWARGE